MAKTILALVSAVSTSSSSTTTAARSESMARRRRRGRRRLPMRAVGAPRDLVPMPFAAMPTRAPTTSFAILSVNDAPRRRRVGGGALLRRVRHGGRRRRRDRAARRTAASRQHCCGRTDRKRRGLRHCSPTTSPRRPGLRRSVCRRCVCETHRGDGSVDMADCDRRGVAFGGSPGRVDPRVHASLRAPH